jgi:hypothetical protein
MELGGVPLRKASAEEANFNMLLWGDSGVGKTTLAATAPGDKLFVLFDVDGDMSIARRTDCNILDLSALPYLQIVEKFRSDDPYGIEAYLKANPSVLTVVIDSMTAFAYLALREAVFKNKSSTMEQPGIHGYTWRNAAVLRAAVSLLTITKRQGRNIIFITHEGTATRDERGNIVSVTMALAEGTANQVGLRLNEVWWMADTGKDRTIAVRPCRLRKPMKTRMWLAETPEFVWRFNAVTMEGEGIMQWFATWKQQEGRKLAFPK